MANAEDIRDAINNNVLLPLNVLLESDGAGEEFARSIYLGETLGEPDFIQHSNEKLRLVIEVKSKWALSASNLVKTYTQNVNDLHKKKRKKRNYHQMRQIFGYLSHNELRYGVLTTYDKTWFLYRENCCLCISPPIQHDDLHPTLFQCLFYLVSLARDNPNCASAPSSQDDDDHDDGGDHESKQKAGSQKARGRTSKGSSAYTTPVAGQGSTGRKRRRATTCPSHPSNGEEEHTPLEFFDWGSFSTLGVLGTGRTGTVFKAILYGEVVALKICDLWKHLDYEEDLLNEVKVYHALKNLQGYCIPKFKGAGYTAGGLFAIATDIVGSPLEDVKSLSDQEDIVIQTALSSIHCHGFVHNDIREDNILIRRNGCQFSAFFIDFAFSKQGRPRDFQNEMGLLVSLLEQS